jgi:hypothetical protein
LCDPYLRLWFDRLAPAKLHFSRARNHYTYTFAPYTITPPYRQQHHLQHLQSLKKLQQQLKRKNMWVFTAPVVSWEPLSEPMHLPFGVNFK